MTAANENAINADVRWVHELTNSLKSAEYARLMSWLAQQDGPEGAASSEAIALYTSHGPDSLLGQLFDMIVKHVELDVDHLLLSICPIPTLDGLTVRAPNGGTPVIVLNHGLVNYVAYSTFLMMALTGWSDHVYCSHFDNSEKLRTLAVLAEGIAKLQPAITLELPAAACFNRGEHQDTHDIHHAFCLISESFILAHEIGHVALHHIDGELAFGFSDELQTDLYQMTATQQAELAADAFAFELLCKMWVKPGTGGLRQADIVYAVGSALALMRFVELVSGKNYSDTHPNAAHRWESLRGRIANRIGPAMMDSVDYLFEFVREWDRTVGETTR